MAHKFENRIDYVDISAYQIGKVKVESPNSPGGQNRKPDKMVNKQAF